MRKSTSTPSPSDSSAAAACSSFRLRRLSRRVSQHFDQIVSVAGLKTTQYSLLCRIVQHEPVKPGELAEHMDMDASTLTRNLRPLMAQGWVEIGPGDDARSRLVKATAAGRKKRVQAQREWKRAQLALNRRLGEARVAKLHAVIDECLALLNAEPAA